MGSLKEKILNRLSHWVTKMIERQWDNAINKLRKNENAFIHPTFILQQPANLIIAEDFKSIRIEECVNTRKFCSILVNPKASLFIGKNVFFNNYCSINCLDKIEIGENTMFGEGVKIYDHNHLIEKAGLVNIVSKGDFSTAPVIIGKNCWIASNVTILKGVTIGDNAVIGAGNLIYKSVPANTVVQNKQEYIINFANPRV